MRRKFNFSIGEFYHIYNRGTDKRDIFTNSYDFNRFLCLLHLCNSINHVDIEKYFREGQSFTDILNTDVGDRIVDIGAWCLMPNHFHLLVREKPEGGISKFMKKLSTAYAMYFNKKFKRTGSLFEGCFKATHVNKDNYLKYLFSYIHLNPIKIIEPKWKEGGIANKGNKEKIRKYLGNYKYSSYMDYIGVKRKEADILNRAVFPKYFNNCFDFSDFINGWLEYGKENILTRK